MWVGKRDTFLIFCTGLLVAVFSGCVGEKPVPSKVAVPQGEKPVVQEEGQYRIGKPPISAGSRWEFDVISNGEKGHLVAVMETGDRVRYSGFWDKMAFIDDESNIAQIVEYTRGLKVETSLDPPYKPYDYPLYDSKKWSGKVDMGITVSKDDSVIGSGTGTESFSGEVIGLVDYVFQGKEYTCAEVRLKKSSETLIDYSGSPVKTASMEEDEVILCPNVGEVETRVALNTTTEAGGQRSEQSTKIELTTVSFEAGGEVSA